MLCVNIATDKKREYQFPPTHPDHHSVEVRKFLVVFLVDFTCFILLHKIKSVFFVANRMQHKKNGKYKQGTQYVLRVICSII